MSLRSTSPLSLHDSSFLRLGLIWAGLAIAAGAFGAHGLAGRLGERELEIFETAARYHMYAALLLGLLGVGLPRHKSGWLLLAGSLLFSGSLYALSISGVRVLGAITPLGGALMIGALFWAGLSGKTAASKIS